MYEGTVFQDWITQRLKEKGVTKFGDLPNPDALDPTDPDQKWRLRVIASDVTNRRMLVLPGDAERLGIQPDDLDVGYAVRMSMSIPIFYEPVVHRNGDKETLIVDGGMLSNFPVWLFDRKDGHPPRWPTFGLLLVEPDPTKEVGERLDNELQVAERGSLVDFVKSLALTMLAAHDRLYVDNATYARTIPIPTLGVGTTEFDIKRERILALRDSGFAAAEEFLSTWNFPNYVAEIRNKDRSRRHTLLSSIDRAGTSAN